MYYTRANTEQIMKNKFNCSAVESSKYYLCYQY